MSTADWIKFILTVVALIVALNILGYYVNKWSTKKYNEMLDQYQTPPPPPATPNRLDCSYSEGCNWSFIKSEVMETDIFTQARSQGWLVWEGHTLGGKHQLIALCPSHKPSAFDDCDQEDEIEGRWDAECDRCRSKASGDWGFRKFVLKVHPDHTGPVTMTHAEAERWCEEHTCEPEAYSFRVDDDG